MTTKHVNYHVCTFKSTKHEHQNFRDEVMSV